jgi:predicted Zn-dependent protease with MMP-like domain
VDPNRYVNEALGFEITKPSAWFFLATPWAVNLRRSSGLSDDELRRVMEQATTPFVYAHLPHSDPHAPFPTLQASCRVLNFKPDLDDLLLQSAAQLEKQFAGVEFIERTAHALIAGCKSVALRVRFSIFNAAGTEFRCLSRSYTLLGSQLAFSIGLTCAADGEYCVEEDIEAVVRSIRVRRYQPPRPERL